MVLVFEGGLLRAGKPALRVLAEGAIYCGNCTDMVTLVPLTFGWPSTTP